MAMRLCARQSMNLILTVTYPRAEGEDPPSDYDPVTHVVATFPNGAYHVYDYQFFFRNSQQNVADRLASFTAVNTTEQAA